MVTSRRNDDQGGTCERTAPASAAGAAASSRTGSPRLIRCGPSPPTSVGRSSASPASRSGRAPSRAALAHSAGAARGCPYRAPSPARRQAGDRAAARYLYRCARPGRRRGAGSPEAHPARSRRWTLSSQHRIFEPEALRMHVGVWEIPLGKAVGARVRGFRARASSCLRSRRSRDEQGPMASTWSCGAPGSSAPGA